jgi:hypothetical protein
MLEFLKSVFHWLSDPAHFMATVQLVLIVVVSAIQFYKLVRRYLPAEIAQKTDKVAEFMSWAVNKSFTTAEGLEKSGLISKSSKLGAFLDQLVLEAKKHDVQLSLEDVLKAKALAEIEAFNKKANTPVAVSYDSLIPEAGNALGAKPNPPAAQG